MAHTCGAEPVKTFVPIKKAASASHTGDGWHLQTEIRLMEEQKRYSGAHSGKDRNRMTDSTWF
jgi:hypothetical protein